MPGGRRAREVSANPREVEPPPSVIAAEASRPEFSRVGVHPISVDPQLPRDLRGVSEARGRGRHLIAQKLGHASRDGLDVVGVEGHALAFCLARAFAEAHPRRELDQYLILALAIGR